MKTGRFNRARGFTQIELMIVIAIMGILASVAISAMRDYSRRASMSEVVLALSTCKNMVAENYTVLLDAPDAGRWGCERPAGSSTKHTGAIQTSSDGVIRVSITNMDRLVDGRHVYMAPLRSDGSTPMTTPDDLGRNVSRWMCGSDWLLVRNALPANCRADTTTFASQDFN
ncbi:MAG: tfp pilus assembly protein major pilin PilA [Ramlibacter sp.]|nr:tfp pilus assembly protein major pilin PilA [Ramlibacter sp.]